MIFIYFIFAVGAGFGLFFLRFFADWYYSEGENWERPGLVLILFSLVAVLFQRMAETVFTFLELYDPFSERFFSLVF